jgi:peroxiredoxin Q/BCP
MKKSLFWLTLLALSVPAFSATLAPGDPAPDFSAKNQDGKTIKLSDYSGKPVLIYFYPKDETPGCTKEACSFRDEFSKFEKKGAVVLGVSTQDEKSHQEFKAKNHLPFDLLVDTDGTLAEQFGIHKYPLVGLLKRESVLVGPDRKVVAVYKDVDPAKHTAQVLADLDKISK